MMQNSEEAAGKPECGQRIISTDSDEIRDYRPRLNHFSYYIGASAWSPEATGDLRYLFRAAPQAPPPLPKHSYVGGVGWGWQFNQMLNNGTLLSNMQIKKVDMDSAGGQSDSEEPAHRAEHEKSAR